jgi:mannose-6-phosphate isomerase-like protein (cupin superfamily)
MYLKNTRKDLKIINQKVNVKSYVQGLKDNEPKLKSKIFKKPWGFEYCIKFNRSMAFWILFLKKKEKTSLHAHITKKTFLIPASDFLFNSIDKKNHVKAFTIIKIDKKTFHQSTNTKNKDMILFEIETPNRKLDLLRYKDKYKRNNSSYDIKKTLKSPKVKELVKKINKKFIIEILGFKNKKQIELKRGDIITLFKGNLKLNGEKIKINYPHKLTSNHTMKKDIHFFKNTFAIVITNSSSL